MGKSLMGAITGSNDAGDESKKASKQQAAYQQRALDYLMETEEVPQELREGALKQLGGVYGLEGGEGSQQDLIDRAQTSPLYASIMGGQKAGEESIARNASMTGGLRSGNVQDAFMDFNTTLQNQALLKSYNEQLTGLSGMANLPNMAPQIAQQTSAIGETLGMGRIGAAQTKQAAKQQDIDLLMGGAMMFSDRKLKKNVRRIGTRNGLNLFTWIWNKTAEGLGLSGYAIGHMADEVQEKYPKAVSVHESSFLMVNYAKLGGE